MSPRERDTTTTRVQIDQTVAHVSIRVAEGRPVDMRIDVHKEGAPFRSILQTVALLGGLALRYGAPVAEVADALRTLPFEPAGPGEVGEEKRVLASVLDGVACCLEAP